MSDLPAWLKHATVWLLLAAGLFLGVQTWMARQKATRFNVQDGTLEIRRGADGHYHWPGRINGRAVEFLVDTGATGTAIPASLSRELGLQKVGQTRSSTAGGVVLAEVVLADLSLDGGVSVQRLRLASLPQLAAPLLGMDVLGRLQWQQNAGTLRIELKAAGDG